ncbi:MAG: leucine-rich repeat domain-containing protein [Firmicutes bacterium]|nr:leucine-rich repeat domain-containing protein [Bacillota bacterium]
MAKKPLNKKKLIRGIIAGFLAACALTGIYYYAIVYLLADYGNMAYITFSYNLTLTEGQTEPEVTITRVNPSLDYPTNFRIPNQLLGYTVTAIGDQAFSLCDRLVKVTMPDTIKSIGAGAFLNCTKLATIDFSSTVDYIGTDALTGTAFLANKSNGLLYIGDVLYTYKGTLPAGTQIKPGSGSEANTVYLDEDVTYIGSGLFKNQTGIVSAEFPSQLLGVGDYVFQGCTNLSSVVLHDATESIGSYAFDGCTNLTALDFPQSLTTIGEYAFRNSGLTGTVTLPDAVTIIPTGTFLDNTGITEVHLPASLEKIQESAFSGCTSLASISFPESVNWIGTSAFQETAFVDITLPKGEGFSVIAESLFYNCDNLQTVYIYENVTSIRTNAFFGTVDLTSMIVLDSSDTPKSLPNVVTLPNSLTALADYAFRYSGLPAVVIPMFVATINQGTFQYAAHLTSVTFLTPPVGNSRLTSIKPAAFEGCSSLTALVLPDTVTTIGDSFLSGTAITSFVFPSGVTTINEYSFSNCANLTSVILPHDLYTIKSYAFENCVGLTSIVIPLSTTFIYNYAFRGSTNLTINAEAASQPANWKEFWNFDNVPVVWGYTGL